MQEISVVIRELFGSESGTAPELEPAPATELKEEFQVGIVTDSIDAKH